MPIIVVTADDGPVHYEVTYWATPLPDVKDWQKAFDWPTEGENFLNWIRVKAVNTATNRYRPGVDVGPNACSPSARHSRAANRPATNKVPSHNYSWSWQLPPGGSAEGVARYTFFPVDDPKKYDQEDAQLWLRRTVDYWQSVVDHGAKIEVPCRKATEALLAAHVCQLIANDHGEVHGGEDFYDTFYIRDGAYQVMELEEAGLMDAAAKAVELYLVRQRDDGRFEIAAEPVRRERTGGLDPLAVLPDHARPPVSSSACIRRCSVPRSGRCRPDARRRLPFAGVLPTAPADGEFLWDGKHHIVGYDVWNLRGMLCTADAATDLGKTDEAKELAAEAAAYRKDIDAAWKRTGVRHFPPSWERVGTHWGNTETLWPTELFSRDDPRVAALSQYVREEFAGGFIEGTIQWKGGGHVQAIHPYMGAYTTMTDLVRGRHEQVVEDFYWYLLHSTAAHAFPEGIFYKKRMAWSHTIPHVTGACNYAIMLRHMLVHEAGDELHLLSAVPDWWLGDGQEIRIERLPTHFGPLNLAVRGTNAGVEVRLDGPTRNPPKRIVLTLPPSRPLVGALEGVQMVQRDGSDEAVGLPNRRGAVSRNSTTGASRTRSACRPASRPRARTLCRPTRRNWPMTAAVTTRTAIGPRIYSSTPAMPGGRWTSLRPPRSVASLSLATTAIHVTMVSPSKRHSTARHGRWSPIVATTRKCRQLLDIPAASIRIPRATYA